MKIKKKLFIHAVKYSFSSEFSIVVNSTKLESYNDCIIIDIDEKVVELNIPDFTQEQFTNGHVEQLRKIKKGLLAETHLKAKSIDEQIESLLAIENKV